MRKVKRIRTADCVVIGFRWAKDQEGEAVGSLLLGLYGPEGETHQVGFSSGFNREERKELVKTLEPYREGKSEGAPPGMNAFSRWNREKDMSYEVLRPGAGRRGGIRSGDRAPHPPRVTVPAMAP